MSGNLYGLPISTDLLYQLDLQFPLQRYVSAINRENQNAI